MIGGRDPLVHAEQIIKNVHDAAGKRTQPVLRRYPLLFAFLIVFSASAILDGFKLLIGEVEIFKTHPGYLLLIGIFSLLLTGTLYKALDKLK